MELINRDELSVDKIFQSVLDFLFNENIDVKSMNMKHYESKYDESYEFDINKDYDIYIDINYITNAIIFYFREHNNLEDGWFTIYEKSFK